MSVFGSIAREKKGWRVHCEPQVRARLRRVFASVTQHASSSLYISDTPEHARDLLWFIDRYPMLVEDKAYLVERAEVHKSAEQAIEALLSKHTPPAKITLAKPPRESQELVAAALEVRGGLLLADDLGVGKTVSAICTMRLKEALPALVVVPAHLPKHWEKKLAEFVPDLHVHTIRESKVYPLLKQGRRGKKGLRENSLPDVLICSYHKLKGWAETLSPLVKLVIFEECQQLRNPGSGIYAACQYVAERAPRRLGLSATPIYNYGSEFYWVLNCIHPEALGTREEFLREWCKGFQGKENIVCPEDFSAYLKREGLMLRRTRADLKQELPPLQKIPVDVEADLEVLSKLEGDAIELAKVILAKNERYKGEKFQAGGEFDRLMRQATGIAKAPYVAEFVRLLLESGEQVILFGWHRAVYDIWAEKLSEYKPIFYTGTESPTQKAEAERLFVTKERPLMFMSTRSGVGTDGLQSVCRTVVVGELDWSSGVIDQDIARVYRDGQTDPVTAYIMVSDHGADPVMMNVLGIKREQSEGVLNPGRALLEPVVDTEGHIRQLAKALLERKGLVPEKAPEPPEDMPKSMSTAS